MFVQLSVVLLVAKSVAAVDAVMLAVVVVMLLGIVVLLVVLVAATFCLCRVRLHRLLRVGSQVDAGRVSRVRTVLCRGLCRCCHGLGLAVERSHVCQTLVGSLCRLYVVVVVVRCGGFVNAVVQSGAGAHCAGLSRVVIWLMLHVVRCVLLRVFYGRVGVLTLSGKTSWCRVGKVEWK